MVSVSKVKHYSTSNGVRPSYAIVLYQEMESGRKPYVCATKHTVNKNNSLSLGQVISPNQIANLFSSLTNGDNKTPYQCIPENVIFDSPASVIWYKKRFVHPMWFRVGKKLECLLVEWTPLLFFANKSNRSLYVFSLSSNSRPTMSTRLYHAPLMNIDETGYLCQGSAKLPHEISLLNLNKCEETLISSQFTHINHDYTLKQKTGNKEHILFWRAKSRADSGKPQRVFAKEMRFSQTLSSLLGKS